MHTILDVKDLTKNFYKNKQLFTAVNHISFQLRQGECLGLVGESGCGNSKNVDAFVKTRQWGDITGRN